MPQHYHDFETEDEYIEQTPLEARFDVNTIKLLCVEAFPKHEAYGMMLEEYQRKRSRFMDSDDSEKKRLSFYLPTFHGRVAADLAIINETSHYRFMILLIELGIITFQHDYHESYNIIREGRKQIVNMLTSDKNHNLYMQLEQHTVDMCSGTGFRSSKSKHFTPSVPEWLYNATADIATNLNMSTSDFVYACWCIGVANALPEDMIPSVLGKDLSTILSRFEMNMKGYMFQIKSTLERMKEDQESFRG